MARRTRSAVSRRPPVLSRHHCVNADRNLDGLPQCQPGARALLDGGDQRIARAISSSRHYFRRARSPRDEATAELHPERNRRLRGDAVNVWGGHRNVHLLKIDKSGECAFIQPRITMSETCVCRICQKPKSPTEGQIAEVIRPSLLECIKKHHPKWDGTGFVCFDDIGDCRKEYVKEVLQDEIGELSALDEEVVESLRQHEIISANISTQFDRKLTFGERLSDRIAEFGGSWRFLITF